MHIVYERFFRTTSKPVYVPVRELEALEDHAGGFFDKREPGLYGAAPEYGKLFHIWPSAASAAHDNCAGESTIKSRERTTPLMPGLRIHPELGCLRRRECCGAGSVE